MAQNDLTRLQADQCGLLVVDIQERMMPVITGREEVVKNSVLLLKTARQLALPVVVTGQNIARIGDCLPEIRQEIGDQPLLDKMEFDCFANEEISAVIKQFSQVRCWIVVGVETHICIYQTVMGGLRQGLKMYVPADAVSSRAEKNVQTGLARIAELGGTIVNTEMVIYELLERAGTDDFKALLPYVK